MITNTDFVQNDDDDDDDDNHDENIILRCNNYIFEGRLAVRMDLKNIFLNRF